MSEKIEHLFEPPIETIGPALDELGHKHGTDKSSAHHNYLGVYEKYFAPMRDVPILLFELGWGSYWKPAEGGHSARMWQEYFPLGEIISIDFYKKDPVTTERVQLFQCSQDNETELTEIIHTNGRPDIIIDDASHVNPLTIRSFEILFPLLKPGGIYCVEDLQTSYWSDHGYEGNTKPGEKGTAMQYFLDLCHQMNHVAFKAEYHHPFKDMIQSVHMYRQMIFIFKTK